MDIIEWVRSLPSWFISVVEPMFFGFGLDAWISLEQFLYIIGIAIIFLVIAVLNYVDKRD